MNCLTAVVGTGLLLSLVACSGDEKKMVLETSTPLNEQTLESERIPPASSMSTEEQIAFSTRALSEQGFELDDIHVFGARQVNWRSGALGCPKPGMNYTQAIVPGFLIQLKVAGEIFAFHAKKGGEPFYCPSDRIEAPAYQTNSELT